MRKTVFVTGASRGIGRGIALVLASAGYDVAFTYNSQINEAESLAEKIKSLGRRCFFYQASMEEPDVPELATRRAINDLNGLGALICNAGLTRFGSFRELTSEKCDFLYNLDFRSYLLCAKAAANDMINRGEGGNIVFISSTRGLRAYPESCVYGAMKAAINHAARSMALELSGHGIRVNVIAPGMTAVREEHAENPFAKKIPLGRAGEPEDIGNAVKFLISGEASYITGSVLTVDGGLILPGTPER